MVIPEKEPAAGTAKVGMVCACGHEYSVTVPIMKLPDAGKEIDVPIPAPTCPKCGTKVTDDLSIKVTGD